MHTFLNTLAIPKWANAFEFRRYLALRESVDMIGTKDELGESCYNESDHGTFFKLKLAVFWS